MPLRRDFLRLPLLSALAIARPRTQAPPRTADDPDSLTAEVDARMALILAQHAGHLDDDARTAVRKDVESTVRRARRLREFPLTNADGPTLILVPYRAPAS